jgi:hypothetical protein
MLAQSDVTVAQMGKASESATPQKETLRRAVIKVVASGEKVGVSADEMIALLKAGFTVGELLEYLAVRTLKSRTGDVT